MKMEEKYLDYLNRENGRKQQRREEAKRLLI